tara:strand:+ start:198 stop:629 length:432 start_codon:yes stop_codon:yes gene_type:complete
MKKLVLVLVMVALTLGINAQKITSTLTTDVNFIEYQTAKNGTVDVNFIYTDKVESETMTDEDLNTIVNYALSATQMTLKSRRSFIPLSMSVKYKFNKKGKHKYSVHLSYAATNSYGGEVEGFEMFSFNKKLKETMGSILLRTN